MSDLTDLYQQIILDHAQHPHGRGLAGSLDEPGVAQSHQINPTCGDEITLRVKVGQDFGDEARLVAVSWEGQGCSISQASSSVLTELVIDKPLSEVSALSNDFRALMDLRGGPVPPQLEDTLEDAAAFAGVSKFPARIKCALLAWVALRDALLKVSSYEGGEHV